MSGLGIGNLPIPDDEYRPDINTRRADGIIEFETYPNASGEDRECTALIKKAAHKFPDAIDKRKAKQLAKCLRKGGGIRRIPPDTLASSRNMRNHRIRIGGALWKLAENPKWDRVSTCTIIPRGWAFTPEELAQLNPIALLEGLRQDLNRAGAQDADGFAFFTIHGEYDPNANINQVHAHGLLTNEMVKVLNRLRKKRKYHSERKASNSTDRVFQRIRISKKPLTNLPEPLTYIVQSFWPSRWIGDRGDGKIIRRRSKSRIPEPAHTQYLLWLDQWEIADLCLLVHLRVTKSGLIETDRKLYTNGDEE